MRVRETADGLLLQVKAIPNASRAGIAGVLGDALKVKVAQPPEAGKANRAVEELIAQTLAVARSQVAVVGGHSQARKTVLITGLTAAVADARLAAALDQKR